MLWLKFGELTVRKIVHKPFSNKLNNKNILNKSTISAKKCKLKKILIQSLPVYFIELNILVYLSFVRFFLCSTLQCVHYCCCRCNSFLLFFSVFRFGFFSFHLANISSIFFAVQHENLKKYWRRRKKNNKKVAVETTTKQQRRRSSGSSGVHLYIFTKKKIFFSVFPNIFFYFWKNTRIGISVLCSSLAYMCAYRLYMCIKIVKENMSCWVSLHITNKQAKKDNKFWTVFLDECLRVRPYIRASMHVRVFVCMCDFYSWEVHERRGSAKQHLV